MSTKHVRTTGDLMRFGCGLRIDCLGCGASRTLDGFEAMRLANGTVNLVVLERRLRCSRCGEKGARVAKLPPGTPQR